MSPAPHRLFLLSPANCSGVRAGWLMREGAEFELARRLQQGEPVSLGEAFSFVSGLYFRGKIAYSSRFASVPAGLAPSHGALVITPNQGLVPASDYITLDELRSYAEVDIALSDERYSAPLQRDLAALGAALDTCGGDCEVVLLGSIASEKYVSLLLAALGYRLRFPIDFVGRGDMSRGGLMLRAAESGDELVYAPVEGAVRRGKRPVKLVPRLAS